MPETDLNVTPITACYYCERKFASEDARWAHMEQIHGVGASERLRLTQGQLDAHLHLQAVLERTKARYDGLVAKREGRTP